MRYSEAWLRSWVNPKLSVEELANLLTLSGLEVEEISPVADAMEGVVIGQVIQTERLQASDQLFLCKVDIQKSHLQIICGASNVKPGIKVAVAPEGALVGKQKIKQNVIRSVKSEGMLCSAFELGLSDKNQEIMILPQDAPVGVSLPEYLETDDSILNISITPNRGDCLSILGLAREISALTHTPLKKKPLTKIVEKSKKKLLVTIKSKQACSHYVGRTIEGIHNNIDTPIWIQEHLRRVGARSINPVVDVMNYVMYELGQPMHAFDCNKINNKIIVRYANPFEKILLLDSSEKELTPDTMIIADDEKPLAIAGVMGGLDSSVTADTQSIFLESAFFSPEVIAKQRQSYNLNSESSYRFERGVDPTLQREAIERATKLILEIVGGKAGPMIEVKTDSLPSIKTITLEKEKIKQVIGIAIPDTQVEKIFKSLTFSFQKSKIAWKVKIPAYRFDLNLAEDLIEEIARLYGYDNIPTYPLTAKLQADQDDSHHSMLSELRSALCHQGYHEVINYSFIDKPLHEAFFSQQKSYELQNPISADMTMMRTSLLPGLIKTLIYNKSRQQERIRIFEIGTCFVPHGSSFKEELHLAVLVAGSATPEQWGLPMRQADFYDIKGDLENILGFFCPKDTFEYKLASIPALHPKQSASVYIVNQKMGILGSLHPSLIQKLDLNNKAFIFELNLDYLLEIKTQFRFQEISKFPEIRRDLAIVIDQTVPAKVIQDTIKTISGNLLKEVFIFDVYQGKGISPGLKSVALALILQDATRTLVESEVAELMERVVKTLKGKLGAELRS